MLWSKTKDETAKNMWGPKTLRSNLVAACDHNKSLELPDLETLELLGQGAYGLVHKVQEKATGQCRVLKTVVRPEGWNDNKLKMEAEILRQLDHPHILRIFAWYEDGDAVNIIMEHCEGGELVKVVKKGRRQGREITEKWLATAVRQTLEALVYMHSKGVVHKDLKGQNILLLHQVDSEDIVRFFETLPHVVVCDLGIAEVCCRGIFGMRGKKVAGTPCTMAPEVWKGSCSPKSDVWSMGCVMYELFSNRLPFEIPGQANLRNAARQQEKWLELHRKGPDWTHMGASFQATSLCRQLLTFKDSARPSAAESLRHPWFNICEEIRLNSLEAAALCQSIMTWKRRTPMQRAFCLKLAACSPCISRFARVFVKFDKDHSGILDKNETNAALQHLGIDAANARKAAIALDVNGDNACEYIEFVAACLFSLEAQFDAMLCHEFRSLDRSGKGVLGSKDIDLLMEELRPLAEQRGIELTDIDNDKDGKVSFSEFGKYFGRPGIVYTDSQLEDTGRKRVPMKQHIRIMNHGSSMDTESLELMRRSKTSDNLRGRDQGQATRQGQGELRCPGAWGGVGAGAGAGARAGAGGAGLEPDPSAQRRQRSLSRLSEATETEDGMTVATATTSPSRATTPSRSPSVSRLPSTLCESALEQETPGQGLEARRQVQAPPGPGAGRRDSSARRRPPTQPAGPAGAASAASTAGAVGTAGAAGAASTAGAPGPAGAASTAGPAGAGSEQDKPRPVAKARGTRPRAGAKRTAKGEKEKERGTEVGREGKPTIPEAPVTDTATGTVVVAAPAKQQQTLDARPASSRPRRGSGDRSPSRRRRTTSKQPQQPPAQQQPDSEESRQKMVSSSSQSSSRPKSPQKRSMKSMSLDTIDGEPKPRLLPHPSDVSTHISTSRGDSAVGSAQESVIESAMEMEFDGWDSVLSRDEEEAPAASDNTPSVLVSQPGSRSAHNQGFFPEGLAKEEEEKNDEKQQEEEQPPLPIPQLHPCRFALSRDNLQPLTLTTMQSTFGTIEKMEMAPFADCVPLGALSWLQLPGTWKESRTSREDSEVRVVNAAPPAGHCVVSL